MTDDEEDDDLERLFHEEDYSERFDEIVNGKYNSKSKEKQDAQKKHTAPLCKPFYMRYAEEEIHLNNVIFSEYREVITKEEITNLKIDLGITKSIEEFLELIGCENDR